MKRIMIGTILIIAIGMMACGNTNKNTQETTGVEQQEKKRSFQLPEVPVMLDTPEPCATSSVNIIGTISTSRIRLIFIYPILPNKPLSISWT